MPQGLPIWRFKFSQGSPIWRFKFDGGHFLVIQSETPRGRNVVHKQYYRDIVVSVTDSDTRIKSIEFHSPRFSPKQYESDNLMRVAVPPPPPLSSLDTLNLWLDRGVLYQSTIGGRSFVYRDIDRDKSTVTEVTRRIRRYRERLPRKKLHVECEDYTQPLYDRTSLPPGMTLLNTWHYPVYYSALRLMTVHPHILHGASFVALFLCDVLSSFSPYSHLLHVRGVNGGYGSQSWAIRQDRKISRRAMLQFLGNSGVLMVGTWKTRERMPACFVLSKPKRPTGTVHKFQVCLFCWQ